MKTSGHGPSEITRRLFVERLARTAFGLSVLPFVPGRGLSETAAPARGAGFGAAKAVIVLQLSGGLSQIDSFDPKTGTSKGPGEPLGTKAGYQLTSYLPETAKVADKLCVIRSMTAKVGVHESARYLMRTGYDQRGTVVHPVPGAWAQHYLGASHDTLPSSVCINRNAAHGNGFLPATMSPLPVLDPDEGLKNSRPAANDATRDKRLALLKSMDSAFAAKVQDASVNACNDFYESTLKLMNGKDLEAFNLSGEAADLRDRYGRNRFGQGCLLARRLVEGGVRFIEVESEGWDMHKDIEGGMEERGREFDAAFAALISDLESRGMLQHTLVAVTTEFGRKPTFDGSGRGHHPLVFSCVLAGGGVKRGFVHGSSDAAGGRVAGDPVTVGELHATMGWALGLPLEQAVTSPAGRPFTLGNNARPVAALFA